MEPSVDSYLSTAIKLLHSSSPDSAEKMRNILEAEILKHFDKSQTLSSKLTKKQMSDLLHQESKAVGSGFKLKRHKNKKLEDVKLPQTPLINENHQIIKVHDDDESSDDDENASTSAAIDLLDDLTCKVCRQMENTANNPLFECIECNQLYHSLCHSTKIPSDTSSWICSTCKAKKDKEGSSKSTKSYDSSASSSSSMSQKNKEKEKEKEKVKEKEKSSEKKKSESRESSSSSSKKDKKESSSSSSSRSRSSKK